MTKFTIIANSDGKEFKIDFDVKKSMNDSEWDQFTKLIKMALGSM